MNIKKQFTEGLITNNPVLVQRIGMCSTMAITTTLFNGIGRRRVRRIFADEDGQCTGGEVSRRSARRKPALDIALHHQR